MLWNGLGIVSYKEIGDNSGVCRYAAQCSHRTPIALELLCAGNAEATGILCFSCDAHVTKHVFLLLLSLTRKLCLLFLWGRVHIVFIICHTTHCIISYPEVSSCFEPQPQRGCEFHRLVIL